MTVRLGMASVRGVGEGARERFEAARAAAPFRSIGDFARRSGLGRPALERLAAAGGFACFGLSRREALWQVAALPRGTSPPLVAAAEAEVGGAAGGAPPLAPMTPREELVADFVGLGLSIDRHPAALVRAALDGAGVLTAAALARTRDGARASVGGMVITRQRPPTAKGMVFITLEDETGIANLVLTPPVYERLRPLARDAHLLLAHGRVEREGLVVNLRVDGLELLPDAEAPGFRPRSFQ
jgi:error-prone DNA polymerase